MLAIDQMIFHFINSTLSNDLFDQWMPIITDLHKNKTFLTYVLPVLLLVWIYRKRWQVLPVMLGLGLCVGVIDNYCYRVLKPHFERERPPAVESEINVRVDRYAGYSFPSNHAANNFAGATFLSYCYPALSGVFYGVAALVALSRVYVGVHYPADILAGAFLGVIFGLFFFKFWSIILLGSSRRWPIFSMPRSKRK